MTMVLTLLLRPEATSQTGTRIVRYELTDCEWVAVAARSHPQPKSSGIEDPVSCGRRLAACSTIWS
jgi:hypothetical protein